MKDGFKMTLGGIVFTFIVVSVSSRSFSQTIKEEVKKFVEEKLEKSGDRKSGEEKKTCGKREPSRKTVRSSGGQAHSVVSSKRSGSVTGNVGTAKKGFTARDNGPGEGEVIYKAKYEVSITQPLDREHREKLPKRVIGRNLKIDLKVSSGYRGWLPQNYPAVSVEVGNYFTWAVSAKAKLFNFLSIERGYYESNGISNPRVSPYSGAIKIGSSAASAAWAIASIGFPVLNVVEPVIRYEARAFETVAKTRSGYDVCLIPYSSSGESSDCREANGSLSMVSSFETITAGIRYFPSRDPHILVQSPSWVRLPSLFFGGGYLSYVKPYQVTIGGQTLNKYLFTGHFRGGGLAFGVDYSGGICRLNLRLWMQVGVGEIKLTRDMSLNELAPEDWFIGYIQGNLSVALPIAVWKFAPTLLVVPEVAGGGASFYFFKVNSGGGQTHPSQNVNWDFLWTARLALVLTL